MRFEDQHFDVRQDDFSPRRDAPHEQRYNDTAGSIASPHSTQVCFASNCSASSFNARLILLLTNICKSNLSTSRACLSSLQCSIYQALASSNVIICPFSHYIRPRSPPTIGRFRLYSFETAKLAM
jgi:hypothetical protein